MTEGGSRKASRNQRQPTRQARQRVSQSRRPVCPLKCLITVSPARVGPNPDMIDRSALVTGKVALAPTAANPIAHDHAKAKVKNVIMARMDRARS